MAEVVRWSSTKTTRLFSGREPGPEAVEVREKVSVRSAKGGRLDVAGLRDLVSALDAAKIPGRTAVTAVLDEGRVTQLLVETELEPPPTTDLQVGVSDTGDPVTGQ